MKVNLIRVECDAKQFAKYQFTCVFWFSLQYRCLANSITRGLLLPAVRKSSFIIWLRAVDEKYKLLKTQNLSRETRSEFLGSVGVNILVYVVGCAYFWKRHKLVNIFSSPCSYHTRLEEFGPLSLKPDWSLAELTPQL